MLALLIGSALCSLMGQISHSANGDVDENAARILKKASDKFSKGSVSFTVTMINKDSDKQETARQSATVLYKGGKYRVELPRQVLYSDGNSVWHWNKDAGEVTVNKLDKNDDDLMNPATLLANYSKNFREKYIRTEEDGTAVIDLAPRGSKSYHKIRIFVAEKNGIVKGMELHNYDGSRGEYHLSKFKSGVKSTDGDFIFDRQANPAVEVIDMR